MSIIIAGLIFLLVYLCVKRSEEQERKSHNQIRFWFKVRKLSQKNVKVDILRAERECKTRKKLENNICDTKNYSY